MERKPTRAVNVGGVQIGGGAPIPVQSMTKTDTRDVAATAAQIRQAAEAGCDIIRCAVPDMEAAKALGAIVEQSPIPIVADIHFHYKLALEAVKQGVHKLRLNPGNIRRTEWVEQVVEACGERRIPMRIGVNAGSLDPAMREKFEGSNDAVYATSEAMVESAFHHLAILENLGFRDVVVSLKAFDVPTTMRAYRRFREQSDYPVHLGITEAGMPPAGIVRSAVGLGVLLSDGIGDTIRVSLTADPTEEVRVGREILNALGLRRSGLTIIACPSCGRCDVDLHGLAQSTQDRLFHLDKELRIRGKELRVAVMGCEVNGPGEARDAHVGIAAGKAKGAIFASGEIIATAKEEELLDLLVDEAEKLARADDA